MNKQPSERLRKVLKSGDTLALFPMLKDWPTEELQALLEDVEWFHDISLKAIDEAWKKTALDPSLFFNAANAEALDRARDEKKVQAMAITSEIYSVAIYYLHQRGVKTE